MTDINFDWRAECAAQAKYWHGACECRIDDDDELRQECDWHRDHRLKSERLNAALRDMIDVVCQADWTAFSLADRAKLDRARELVKSARTSGAEHG